MRPTTSTASSAEAPEKRDAVLEAASRAGSSGLIATEPSTVRWLLCGRGRPVVSSTATYLVVVGGDDAVVLAPDNEGPRVAAEERFEELGYRVELFPWHEGPEAILGKLAPDFAAETDLGGAIPALRRSLRPQETERYRTAARDTADALEEALRRVQPEATELDVAADIAAACVRRGLVAPVNLVGGEGRQETFRHPIPTDARIGRHALLAVTAERHGLFTSLTRIVSFGAPPSELARAVRVAAEVDAAMLAASRPGTGVDEVLRIAAAGYERHGFPNEWHQHHQGGIAGYAGREVIATPNDSTPLSERCAVTWNPSVKGGGESEDTALVGPDGIEILTRTPDLPEVEAGGMVRAGILVA